MEGYITPDVLKVEALDNYLLKILFDTQEEKIYKQYKYFWKIYWKQKELIVYFKCKLLAILKIVEHWKKNIFAREIYIRYIKKCILYFKIVNNKYQK